MHIVDIRFVILVIVVSLRVTWGSSEGNQRRKMIGYCFERCSDILLLEPQSIQESSGTIQKLNTRGPP